MKSIYFKDILVTFIARFKKLIADPLLETTAQNEIQALVEPSNKEIINAGIFLSVYATAVGVASQLSSLPLPHYDFAFIFGFVIGTALCCLLLFPVIIILGSLIGFGLVRLFGGKKSFRHYLGVCIVELPISLGLSLLCQAGVKAAAVSGVSYLALILPLLPMVAAYRNFVLNGVGKKASAVIVAGLYVLGTMVVIAQVAILKPQTLQDATSFQPSPFSCGVPDEYPR